jgi:hypothetical protein
MRKFRSENQSYTRMGYITSTKQIHKLLLRVIETSARNLRGGGGELDKLKP